MRVQQARHAFRRISGAWRLSAGLFSTLQDCSLLFRIKAIKNKTKHKNKKSFFFFFLFPLQHKDTPDIDLTSLNFSSQDKTWNVSLLQLHPGTRGIHQDSAIMRQAVLLSLRVKPECLSCPVKCISLYFCFGLSQ